MSCVIRLDQNQNESINSILYRGHLFEKIFLRYALLHDFHLILSLNLMMVQTKGTI